MFLVSLLRLLYLSNLERLVFKSHWRDANVEAESGCVCFECVLFVQESLPTMLHVLLRVVPTSSGL